MNTNSVFDFGRIYSFWSLVGYVRQTSEYDLVYFMFLELFDDCVGNSVRIQARIEKIYDFISVNEFSNHLTEEEKMECFNRLISILSNYGEDVMIAYTFPSLIEGRARMKDRLSYLNEVFIYSDQTGQECLTDR